MSDSPDPVTVGGDLTYTMVVTNLGPDGTGAVQRRFGDAVTLSDLLPAGSAYKASSTTKGTCREAGNTTFICDLGHFDKDDEATVTLTVVPSQPGTVVNTAAVYTSGGALGSNTPFPPIDPDPSSNQATAMTTVKAAGGGPTPPGTAIGADLSLTFSDDPDPVEVGGELTYTLKVVNNGPAEASLVRTSTLLPPGAVYRRSSAPGICLSDTVTVDCDIGTLAPSGGATVAVVVVPSRPGPLASVARVNSQLATPDPNPGNNVGTTTTTVNGDAPPLTGADLSVEVSDSADPVQVNADVAFTIAVKNEGPVASGEALVSYVLPPGVTVQSDKFPSGCSFPVGGLPFSCRVKPLRPGESTTFVLTVTVGTPGVLISAAELRGTSTEADPNLANNQSIETTTVSAGPAPSGAAELALAVEDAPDPVNATEDLTYALVVHNAGSDAAQNVVVTDLLPAGVSYKSASAGCEFNSTLRVVTCRRDAVAAGTTATMSIAVVAERAGSVSNTARVDSTTPDTELSNNQASTATTIEPAADLALTKTATPNPVQVDADLTYGLAAANNGPDTAEGVAIVDKLPPGATFKSSSSGCSFDAGSHSVTCSLGDLAQGGSGRATVTVVSPQPGNLSSTARAAASTFDPDPSDNEASVDVRAECGAGGCASSGPPDTTGGHGNTTGGGGSPTGRGGNDPGGGNTTGGGNPAARANTAGGGAGGPAQPGGSGAPSSGGGTSTSTNGSANAPGAVTLSGSPPALAPGPPASLSAKGELDSLAQGPPVLEPLPSSDASRGRSLPLLRFVAFALLLAVSIPTLRMLKRQYPEGLPLRPRLSLRR